MTQRSLLQRARASLARDRDLSLGQKFEKGLANGAALVRAPFFLRACDRVGARARTRGKPVVENLGTIEIGDDFQLNCAFAPVRLFAGPGATLRIGDEVNVNFGADIAAEDAITIGSRVSFGPYVVVADHDREEPGGAPEPVTIGDDVWLAARVRVSKGVTIGEGTVVTAGSVVTASLPAGVVAGGAPARVLRPRRPTDTPPAEPAPDVEAPPNPDVRGLIVADFTATELAVAIEKTDDLGPRVAAEIAPFDQVVQTLLALASPTPAHDFAFVWTRPERAIPAFAQLLAGDAVTHDALLAEVDAFAERVLAVKGARFTFVAAWALPPGARGLGMLDMKSGGASRALAAMNLRLAERLDASPTTFVLDPTRWLAAGEFDPRLWYLGKVGFSREVFAAAAADLRAAIRGVRGHARKLLVLDLDDTMWGGIVGDLGWQNLKLGGHDMVGEALVDFQREVLALSKRGVALAVVSKNEETVALEAIRSHPEMIVRDTDLVGWRINWRDKAQNIADLVQSLNLGLQSVVFIDDNPIERARVREALPEVFVPEWPEDKTRYVSAFRALGCFDVPSLSAEDAARTRMYVEEKKREELRAQVGSLDEWLLGLGTKVQFARLAASNLPRTAQLLNKTNQMNLRTRRLSETELMEWASAPSRELWAVSVSDKLGAAGLTGILGLEWDGARCVVTDYVLSCRVMGRRVEETLVWFATERAKARGATRLEAHYVATPKNKPCLGFFAGLAELAREGDVFTWDATKPFPQPRGIEVVVEAAP
ncbi:MAG TPA: HAD-IIIC family phosphatase [Polyangiaceae bacterium]|jgi:FkbH-like protein